MTHLDQLQWLIQNLGSRHVGISLQDGTLIDTFGEVFENLGDVFTEPQRRCISELYGKYCKETLT